MSSTQMDKTNGIVAIVARESLRRKGKDFAGTGFLVQGEGENLLLTCAHVLEGAKREGETLFFRFGISRTEYAASLVAESPFYEIDCAILRPESLPAGLEALPLCAPENPSGHPFSTYGYPQKGSFKGLHAHGTVGGYTADEEGRPRLQISTDGKKELLPGYSGAPVWDEKLGAVVGMVKMGFNEGADENHFDTSFAVTISDLHNCYPGLVVEACAEKPNVVQPTERHDSIGYIPPASVVTYIHRGKIEDEVKDFLRTGNGTGAIVGLHAPGGLGKTELAKHAAEELKAQFEGILWIDVGEKTSQQVVGDMLLQCGVQTRPGAAYAELKNELHHALQNHRWLVIFDDLHQAAVEGLADFLPPKPCAALITSRIQQIKGVNKTFPLDQLTPEQARALLEAILGEAIVAAEKEAAERLATRCAYNPLALEVAARRARQFSGLRKPIERYFELAQARFKELRMEGDARWDMERIFDISYADLSPDDQRCFRALAAFAPSGFAPAAAARLWNGEVEGARGILSRLINLSLVKMVPGELERYRLHDLLDEYDSAKLAEDPEEEKASCSRLADWLAELFDEHYTDDPDSAPEAAAELDNLIKSARWAMREQAGETLALLATQPRNWLSVVFNVQAEWHKWLIGALQIGIDEPRLKANCIQALGDVHRDLSELPEARARYEEALPIYHAIGAKLGEANTLSAVMRLDFAESKDIPRAEKELSDIIEIRQKIGDSYGEAADCGNFAIAVLNIGEKALAKKYLLRTREIFARIGVKSAVKMTDGLLEQCEQ